MGKITRLPLREVWKHEAIDFTRWLAENVDVLNEAIDLDLTIVDRESAAGDFKLDLLAEDGDGRAVVIENQLGRSDHDHLGKLLTYLSNFEAKAAIWIVGEARSEHVSAISWLNESSTGEFYLLKAEAISIDTSPAALLLTQIVGPSVEQRSVAAEKKNISHRQSQRREFWTQLLERAKAKTQLHSSVSPGTLGWLGTGAGVSGFAFTYVIYMNGWRVELYIDRGKKHENEWYYDQLLQERELVERDFGDAMSWQKLEAKRACRIAYQQEGVGGYRSSPSEWGSIQDHMIDAMIRLEKSLQARVLALPRDCPVDADVQE